MTEIIENLAFSVGSALATGFGTWFFTRRKYNAESAATEVQNFDAAIDAYKKMYEDMISDLKENQEELKRENRELKEELAENRKQIMTLTNFVLASAIRRADCDLQDPDLEKLRSALK